MGALQIPHSVLVIALIIVSLIVALIVTLIVALLIAANRLRYRSLGDGRSSLDFAQPGLRLRSAKSGQLVQGTTIPVCGTLLASASSKVLLECRLDPPVVPQREKFLARRRFIHISLRKRLEFCVAAPRQPS